PQPQAPDLERHRAAIDLLAGLRRDEPRLLLGEHDVRRLAPAVAAWLERDAHPDAVRQALTTDLPDHLKQPAGLLAHRLTALLPPPLPAAPTPARPRDPLQNCDKCDRAFRAPEPGRCRDCRTDLAEAA
ncbi:helix-turn-helix domain-containing protein, partial [Streptomyces lunaelactis]|nr:helix-turn-helix domain-containing protein [Streptomyces lunaelactis]NUK75202.1 helix-turn-helix domain-containing protein [Streptomyces lunaelactis]